MTLVSGSTTLVSGRTVVSWPRLRTSPFTLAFYLIYLFSNVTVQYYRKVICNLWQNYTWVKTSIVNICDDIDDRLTGLCFSCVKNAHNVVDVQPSRGQAPSRYQVTAETDPYRAVSWSRKALLWKRAVEASYASQVAMEWSGIDY